MTGQCAWVCGSISIDPGKLSRETLHSKGPLCTQNEDTKNLETFQIYITGTCMSKQIVLNAYTVVLLGNKKGANY